MQQRSALKRACASFFLFFCLFCSLKTNAFAKEDPQYHPVAAAASTPAAAAAAAAAAGAGDVAGQDAPGSDNPAAAAAAATAAAAADAAAAAAAEPLAASPPPPLSTSPLQNSAAASNGGAPPAAASGGPPAASGAPPAAGGPNPSGLAPSGAPLSMMSLEAAESVAAEWPCGLNSKLYYLIANPVSGSRLGAKFITSLPESQMEVGCRQVRVFSQKDPNSMKVAVDRIAAAVNARKTLFAAADAAAAAPAAAADPAAAAAAAAGGVVVPLSRRVRVIAVGGDGAFNGMVLLLSAAAAADMNWIAAGVIPSGTGNDLAHTYGWGRAPFPVDQPLRHDNLSRILDILDNSDLVFHDYWRVTATTAAAAAAPGAAAAAAEDDNGFYAWDDKNKKLTKKGDDYNGGAHTKSFIMSNYFSLGFEGVVGTQFDRYRGSSRLWNRALYGFLFLRYSTLSPTLCSALDTVYTFSPQLVAVLSNNDRYQKVPRILPCVSVTFLNARTILGGLELWGPSVKVGFGPPPDPAAFQDFEAFAHKLLATKADSGDGKIEIFSMASTTDYVQAQAKFGSYGVLKYRGAD
ncbi:diacylglycerol kinase, putative [Eimeria brunetti]|uniref:diacylglycerol kinase (ATP) n=1 Tax=Eimeria brunetti TaxID=51314 RepID=U6LQC1_9EIME|nr:diacylglycerol kinase, putative [Eimeria brunetti]